MLSDEERKAIKEVNHFKELTRYWQEEEYEEKEIAGYIETILNLIEKQSKEIEELKEENKKKSIVIIEYQDLYEKLQDKIKAKIEELDCKDIGNFERRCKQEVLQSLLEKE